MHKTTLYLEDDLYETLKRLADSAGETQASIIREALRSFVSGKRPRRPRSIGLGRGGKDLSERVEEALAGMGND
jgi:hypothetical protein